MVEHLVLTVRLHDRRYHGMPVDEWPPAPARVFQALVAGVARGTELAARYAEALGWLEGLPPPVIAAPFARLGARVDLFVPNNDADLEGGAARTSKSVQPRLIEGDPSVIYAWQLVDGRGGASDVIAAAEQLYQLGRGIDMAWSFGEVIDDDELASRFARHRGGLHRPATRGHEHTLPCPIPGSLASLIRRHRTPRLRAEGEGRNARMLFVNAPKPRFASISYAERRQEAIFELRQRAAEDRPWPWPMFRVAALVQRLRDAAAEQLRSALPGSRDAIDAAFGSASMDGPEESAPRIHLMPLPSIGHHEVDRAIRRVVVEVPDPCPLSPADVAWAFAGLEPADPVTGEVDPFVLTRSSDTEMLDRHYRWPTRRFRSVTPLVLPVAAKRRRIEPSRQREEAKTATERAREHLLAIDAVRVALRQAGVRARLIGARVQREPFEPRGIRAERFAPESGFEKERLWHVDLELDRHVEGPLLLGDGRFVGLGLMAPVRPLSILAFRTDGETIDPVPVVRAMRRAVMSRVQREIGNARLSRYFTGHEDDRTPARGERASHLAFQIAPDGNTILLLGPDVLDRRHPLEAERACFSLLERALEGMSTLRVSRQTVLELQNATIDDTAPWFATSRHWESVRPYEVNRHQKAGSAVAALTLDILDECSTRKLPRPDVEVLDVFAVPGRGLRGRVRISFARAVSGPIVLGRSRYLGGGLFAPSSASPDVAPPSGFQG